MAARQDQGFQRLLQAEEDAKKLIDEALDAREKAQEEMYEFVESEIKRITLEKENEFKEKFGKDNDDDLVSYEDTLKKEKIENNSNVTKQYNTAKEVVANILLHKVGKIDIEVSDAIKQALLNKYN